MDRWMSLAIISVSIVLAATCAAAVTVEPTASLVGAEALAQIEGLPDIVADSMNQSSSLDSLWAAAAAYRFEGAMSCTARTTSCAVWQSTAQGHVRFHVERLALATWDWCGFAMRWEYSFTTSSEAVFVVQSSCFEDVRFLPDGSWTTETAELGLTVDGSYSPIFGADSLDVLLSAGPHSVRLWRSSCLVDEPDQERRLHCEVDWEVRDLSPVAPETWGRIKSQFRQLE